MPTISRRSKRLKRTSKKQPNVVSSPVVKGESMTAPNTTSIPRTTQLGESTILKKCYSSSGLTEQQ